MIPAVVLKLVEAQRGLVLVTGATGSGKTTTMACMLHHINTTMRKHVVTIEDPIEFTHEDRLAVISQREIGNDTKDFATALRHVVRQNPDVIFIGEMRDQETIAAALTAAETGHLVIATLHTNDSIQSIDRIIDVFPPHQQQQIRVQLAFSLLGVISQRLMLKKDGKGRIMAAEVLIKNFAVANHIREGKTHQTRTIMEGARKEGMMTLDHRLGQLFNAGLIDLNEVTRNASSPTALHHILGLLEGGTSAAGLKSHQ